MSGGRHWARSVSGRRVRGWLSPPPSGSGGATEEGAAAEHDRAVAALVDEGWAAVLRAADWITDAAVAALKRP